MPPTIGGEGRFTLPGEAGREDETLALAEKWGADVIRDSDGTHLSPRILAGPYEIYSTLCLVRADQDFARAHPEFLQQKYLISDRCTAGGDGGPLTVDLLAGWFRQQFAIDFDHDPKRWWEIIDRTTGDVVQPREWSFDAGSGTATIEAPRPWHVYTVSFLVRQIWDPVSMYNHLTNQWTRDHVMAVDPRHPEVRRHLLEYLDRWLAEHPHTDVVRLTTLFYNFTFNFGPDARKRYVDWTGYSDCVSPGALEQFAEEYGYRLRPEHLVDEGLFNYPSRVPTDEYLDWMEFTQRFVTDFGRQVVQRIHAAGKKAIMFFCDHWIGTEPFGEYFSRMELDGLANPVDWGSQARRIALAGRRAGGITTEIRLYPYFFPVDLGGNPVFRHGGNPVRDSIRDWMKVRRAVLRDPVDRIGYGGYLSLTLDHGDFLDHVADLAEEFRDIHRHAAGTMPACAPFRVAVLNAWGELRSWITEEWRGGGLAEALSGLPLEVDFINFDDVRSLRAGEGVGVVINTGGAGTAWSGGRHWTDPAVVSAVRRFVAEGGGFLGVGEPTAAPHGGRFFQLADVLGVEREIGHTTNWTRPAAAAPERHFILADQPGPPDLGPAADRVYPADAATEILAGDADNVLAAAHGFGRGRAVYLAGFTASPANTRLLLRALLWAASREDALHNWFATNIHTELAAFPGAGWACVINNSPAEQTTTVHADAARSLELTLPPHGCRWIEIGQFPNG